MWFGQRRHLSEATPEGMYAVFTVILHLPFGTLTHAHGGEWVASVIDV